MLKMFLMKTLKLYKISLQNFMSLMNLFMVLCIFMFNSTDIVVKPNLEKYKCS